MTALLNKRGYQPESLSTIPLLLAAGAKATQGGMACLDTTNHVATPGASGNANLIRVGTWIDNVDNSAGTTTTYAMARLDYEIWGYWWDNATGGAAIGAAQLYTTSAYILDDHTLTNSATGNSSAGRVWSIKPDGSKVFVQESRIG